MKLNDCITHCPTIGTCKIDVNKTARCFGMSFISRWYDKYRLVNQRAGIKIIISKEDAYALIKKLNLLECPSPIFSNASSYMTKTRLEKMYGPPKRKVKE